MSINFCGFTLRLPSISKANSPINIFKAKAGTKAKFGLFKVLAKTDENSDCLEGYGETIFNGPLKSFLIRKSIISIKSLI